MRVLLLCDDRYHPGQVPTDGIAPLQDKFEFDIITDVENFDHMCLADYQVIMLSKSDHVSSTNLSPWKTDAMQQAFVDYVENGGGLVVVHSGTVAGDNVGALAHLIGCRFTFHPKDCPVIIQPVKPHPITEGVEAFCEMDEHYHIEILTDDIDVLIAAYADQQDNTPAAILTSGYVRKQGKGRVCVLTPGHYLSVWLNANFQRTLENALRWCAQGIPVSG